MSYPNLDTPSGHIAVGLLFVYTLILCKWIGIDGGIENLLSGLIGLALGKSLKGAGDGK